MRPGSSNGGGVGGGGWAQPGSSSNGLGGSSSNIGGGLGGGGSAKPGSSSSSTGLGSSSGGSSVFGKPGKGGKPSKGKWVKKVVIGAGALYTGYKVGYGRDASFFYYLFTLSGEFAHMLNHPGEEGAEEV